MSSKIKIDQLRYVAQLARISLNDEELILIEVEGDLKEVISTVIREKGMNIRM